MEFLFPLAAFTAALIAIRHSLGLGFAVVCAVGYFSGVIRANYLGVFTTFMFDFAVFGLYVGFFLGRSNELRGLWERPSGKWTLTLIGWPAALTLLPFNDYLVQVAALRATVWFLPVMLIASRLTAKDLSIFVRAIAVLNLFALAGGIYVYLYGVESLYPVNVITRIIYNSRDVSGGNHRIPSTFLNAHAYGGTMLGSLALLMDRVFGPKVSIFDRWLAAAGVVAAVIGILMCAARQPMVTLAVAALITFFCTRFNLQVGLVAVALVVALIIAGLIDERLHRGTSTFQATDIVSGRIQVSANEQFLDLFLRYPLGAGMGSSVGTSIPYFLLAARPTKAIGMENEYCRILIDQGWMGLIIWLGFLVWLFRRPLMLNLSKPWAIGLTIIYAFCLTGWLTAFIGTGMLASIPGAFLLLMHMGLLVGIRERGSESIPDKKQKRIGIQKFPA